MDYTYQLTTVILWLAWFVQWLAYRKLKTLLALVEDSRDNWKANYEACDKALSRTQMNGVL